MQVQFASVIAELFLMRCLIVPSGKQTSQAPVSGSLTVVKGLIFKDSLLTWFISGIHHFFSYSSPPYCCHNEDIKNHLNLRQLC
jgi:hypothetical protein